MFSASSSSLWDDGSWSWISGALDWLPNNYADLFSLLPEPEPEAITLFGVETISEVTLLPNLALKLLEFSFVGVRPIRVLGLGLLSIISKPEFVSLCDPEEGFYETSLGFAFSWLKTGSAIYVTSSRMPEKFLLSVLNFSMSINLDSFSKSNLAFS